MRAITSVANGICHHPSKGVTSNTRNTTTRWSRTETADHVERLTVLPRNEPKSSTDRQQSASAKAIAHFNFSGDRLPNRQHAPQD
jgi:hypothetical protein